MAHARLERSDVGAWVLKASPAVWDVNEMIADQQPPPENFRLHETYRVSLIEVGDPVWLWTTASRTSLRRPARFVALGRVSGRAAKGQGGGPYWVDDVEAGRLRPYLPVELEWLATPILSTTVRAHPTLSSFELLRATSMSNPSYLTPEQDAAMRSLMR
jgi:hypothetical protein